MGPGESGEYARALNGCRPCAQLRCAFSLALDVNEETGALVINAPFRVDADGLPDIDLDALPHTCALDAADAGGLTLEQVGAVMDLTRERTRNVVDAAVARVRHLPVLREAGPADGPRGWDASMDPPGKIGTGMAARCGSNVLSGEDW